VQPAALLWYSVKVPDLSATKVTAGWLCQGTKPPGSTVIASIATSEAAVAWTLTGTETLDRPRSVRVSAGPPVVSEGQFTPPGFASVLRSSAPTGTMNVT
jgi:hypothetical protein